MKPTTHIILTFALFTGCKMSGSNGLDDFDLYDGPVYGGIKGFVLDARGNGLADIPVTLSSGEEILTDEEGAYHFTRVEPDTYVVKVSVLEYAEQFRRVVIDDWRTHNANFELYPTGVIFDVDNTQGGLFQEGRLLVDAPPYAFAGGDDLQLALTVPDLLETGTYGAPGDFRTVDEDGVLVSYGFWDIRVFEDGELINVADGQTVTLDYELWDEDEVPEAQRHLMGDTMPLWTFDADEAGWVRMDELDIQEDDRGRRSVTAELPHFSPWNCDDLFASTCVEVWVEDQLGNAIEGVEVSLTGMDYISTTITNTDDNGLGVVQGMPNGTGAIKASMMVGDRPYNEVLEGVELGAAVGGGSICPVSVTMTIPVCMVGGDIKLSVINSFGKDEGPSTEIDRIPAGSAVFYRPGDEFGACADPLGEEMEPGDWVVLDPTDDPTDLYKPEDNENMGAGDIIRIEDDSVAIDMTVEEATDGDLVYVTVETEGDSLTGAGPLMTDGNSLDIRVQGELDGLPGFEAENAIEVTDAPQLEVVSDGGTTIEFQKGYELDIELQNSIGSPDPTYVMVMGEDDELMLGKFDANIDPTLPAWVTEEMADDSAITVFKQRVTYVELPNGYYARTTAMNASTVMANEAGTD
jgi:hypothetical protein